MAFFLLLGSGVIACLLPLCLYLYGLAVVNARPRPTVVPGAVDFCLLVAGLSGFLIMGGPVALSFFDNKIAGLKLASDLNAMANAFANNQRLMIGLSIFYVVLVAALIVGGNRMRRRQTVIYNVTSGRLNPILDEILAAETPPIRREGSSPAAGVGPTVSEEANSGFRSICLCWNGVGRATQNRLEGVLANRLLAVTIDANPLSGKLMNVAFSLGVVMAGVIGLVILIVVRVG